MQSHTLRRTHFGLHQLLLARWCTSVLAKILILGGGGACLPKKGLLRVILMPDFDAIRGSYLQCKMTTSLLLVPNLSLRGNSKVVFSYIQNIPSRDMSHPRGAAMNSTFNGSLVT